TSVKCSSIGNFVICNLVILPGVSAKVLFASNRRQDAMQSSASIQLRWCESREAPEEYSPGRKSWMLRRLPRRLGLRKAPGLYQGTALTMLQACHQRPF